ncbi:atp-binding cassette sub-family b [Holotrichia oblita]|nr:atp-binding cassette sub-family b [Holotrichia oblita]
MGQSKMGELNAVLQDNISGIREIQAFNKQKAECENVKKSSVEHITALLKALGLGAIYHPGIQLFSSMGTVFVIGYGGYLASLGQLSISDIVAFILYLNMFYQPITALARINEDVQSALAGAERIFEVLDTDSDIKDLSNAVNVGALKGDIRFNNVSFRYNEEGMVLKNITIRADAGESIALVGRTGVDNIACGKPDATYDEIEKAAKLSRADEFINDLKEGYNTYVGERGFKLSGGQKQRISIARAILRDKPILILDEATAAVDVETEKLIQEAMDTVMEGRTTIIIAHRLSTIKKADKIYVLKDGEVVEEGNHEQLEAQGGLYKMYTSMEGIKMEKIFYPDEQTVKLAIENKDPLLMLVSHGGDKMIVSNIDDAFEHHILLAKVGEDYKELENYFRIVLDDKSADWTFVCPNNYREITDRAFRLKQFYKDGFSIIPNALTELGYVVGINIPTRYRRHIDEMK